MAHAPERGRALFGTSELVVRAASRNKWGLVRERAKGVQTTLAPRRGGRRRSTPRRIAERYSAKRLRCTEGFKWQSAILFSNLKLKFLGTGLMVPEEVRVRYHIVFSRFACV